jgi:phosphohistidine phosphatase
MKTLLLMRHAKSSWKDEALPDHERPLTKRGRKDSKRMAKVI